MKINRSINRVHDPTVAAWQFPTYEPCPLARPTQAMSVPDVLVGGWMPFSPVNLSWSTRCTNSDVMSTTVTTKPAPAAALRRAVMSMRGRGRQMNLPARNVSAVPQALPHSKRCQLLSKERDEFMATLKAERDGRERAERTSATRIQVCTRRNSACRVSRRCCRWPCHRSPRHPCTANGKQCCRHMYRRPRQRRRMGAVVDDVPRCNTPCNEQQPRMH